MDDPLPFVMNKFFFKWLVFFLYVSFPMSFSGFEEHPLKLDIDCGAKNHYFKY